MKKIILVLFLTITLISFANAKTVIFKNCFYAYESKFDNKKWEKNEIVVDTDLKTANLITIFTDNGLSAEIERIRNFKELGDYKPQKVNINNYFRVEYSDNKYIQLISQNRKSKLTLDLDNYTVDQTFLRDGMPYHTSHNMTCSSAGVGVGGAKDTLKKIIGK
jgi:hypothetical protein